MCEAPRAAGDPSRATDSISWIFEQDFRQRVNLLNLYDRRQALAVTAARAAASAATTAATATGATSGTA
jgi:hypothetical protein